MSVAIDTFSLTSIDEGDLDLLHEMDRNCFAPDVAYDRQEMAYFLRLPGSRGFLAREEDNPAGFILFIENHVITLDVLPAFRRRGLGRWLMDLAMEAMAEEGYTAVYLEVDADNEPALGLYRSLGLSEGPAFREMGRRRLLMIGPLSPSPAASEAPAPPGSA